MEHLVTLMHSARVLIAAAKILLACNAPSRAQARERRGWALLPGLGGGVANVACDGCARGWDLPGPILFGAAAYMFTPHLGVGLGLDQWWRSPADSEATNTATILLHYYPSVRAGAFAEAGVGLSRAKVRLEGNTVAAGRGWAFMAAVGYDVRILRGKTADYNTDFTLKPRASYVYSSIGELKYADSSPPFATGWRHPVLSVGLAFGFTFRQ